MFKHKPSDMSAVSISSSPSSLSIPGMLDRSLPRLFPTVKNREQRKGWWSAWEICLQLCTGTANLPCCQHSLAKAPKIQAMPQHAIQCPNHHISKVIHPMIQHVQTQTLWYVCRLHFFFSVITKQSRDAGQVFATTFSYSEKRSKEKGDS